MPLRRKAGSKLQAAKTPVGHRLALAPSSRIMLLWRLMWVTVQLDFKASASASQQKRGVETASSEDPAGTPWPRHPRLRSCCNRGRRGSSYSWTSAHLRVPFRGATGAGSKLPYLCHRESSCLPQSRTSSLMGFSDLDLQLCDCVVQPKCLKKQLFL